MWVSKEKYRALGKYWWVLAIKSLFLKWKIKHSKYIFIGSYIVTIIYVKPQVIVTNMVAVKKNVSYNKNSLAENILACVHVCVYKDIIAFK